MTDLTTTVSLSDITDLKYDDSRGLLFLTTSSGTLYSWNPQSGAFADSIALGGSLSGFDITPDSQYALVGRADASGLYSNEIYRVQLSNLSVEQLDFPLTGPSLAPYEQGLAHIAIVGSDTALATTNFAGSGWNPFREFDAEASTITPTLVAGLPSIRQSSYLIPSEHDRYVLIMENNISDGALEIYDSTEDKITASTDLYAIGSSGFNTGKADISEDAGLVLDITYNNVYVFDTNLSLDKDLSSLQSAGAVAGGRFSAGGHQLFLMDARTDELLVYDTQSWTQVGSLDLGVDIGPQPDQSTVGLMSLSGDGRMLFVTTASNPGSTATGFEAIDLAARLHLTVQGDAAHTQLYGSVGSDTLITGAGDDTLTGGGGADTFVIAAGSGADTVTDFSQGDKLELPLHSFADVLASAIESHGDTIISLPGGTSVTLDNVPLSSLQAGDFIFVQPVVHPANDFGQTGVSSVLFRDASTGDWGFMSANAAGGETWHPIGPSSADYAAVGKGDFNGDGVLDTAFRQTSTGDLGFLTVSPTGGESWHAVGPTSLAYDAVGAADFNGDGAVDIAFRNPATGDWGYMSVNPAGGETWHAVGPSSTDYAVIGVGDFNGDGLQDLAFRQTSTGDWGFLTPNPAGGETWHAVGPTSLSYDAVAVADFNGDGMADIAFRDPATGDWGYMSANPAGGQTWHAVGPSSADYAVIGAGDFNGDGLQDLAFRQTSTGDWGFLTPNPSGGETWHPVGATSTAYMAV